MTQSSSTLKISPYTFILIYGKLGVSHINSSCAIKPSRVSFVPEDQKQCSWQGRLHSTIQQD